MPKKLILTVIDGLGPALLDRVVAAGRAPTLAHLQELGERTDACVSTFPSLTPVCLSSLITGRHPAGHRIPSMTWYHRDEGRFVEYGSSFLATLAEGTRQMVDDVLVNLNLLHLSPRATTVFEALEDEGLVTAAVNTYICRGRVRHPITREAARRIARRVGIVDAVYGPRRYFFGELFWSDDTGAPRNFGGSVDRHGGHVGRWLVTRDGFDFLFLYLYETDAAQHRGGDVMGAVEQADASAGTAGRSGRRVGPVPGALRRDGGGRPQPERGGAGRRRARAAGGAEAVPLQPPLRSGRVRPGRGRQQPGGDGLPPARRPADRERGRAPVRPAPVQRRRDVAGGRLVRRAPRGR